MEFDDKEPWPPWPERERTPHWTSMSHEREDFSGLGLGLGLRGTLSTTYGLGLVDPSSCCKQTMPISTDSSSSIIARSFGDQPLFLRWSSTIGWPTPTPVLGRGGRSDSEDPPSPVTLLLLVVSLDELLNVEEKLQLFIELAIFKDPMLASVKGLHNHQEHSMAERKRGRRGIRTYTVRGPNKVVIGDCVLMPPAADNTAPDSERPNRVRLPVQREGAMVLVAGDSSTE